MNISFCMFYLVFDPFFVTHINIPGLNSSFNIGELAVSSVFILKKRIIYFDFANCKCKLDTCTVELS